MGFPLARWTGSPNSFPGTGDDHRDGPKNVPETPARMQTKPRSGKTAFKRAAARRSQNAIPAFMRRHRHRKGISPIRAACQGAKDVITTQYNDEALLKLGLLKRTFWPRTLTVIERPAAG